MDTQLTNIQKRVVALTRPLDSFMDKLVSDGGEDTEAIEFVNTFNTLLSDTASYITQLRMDNVCREARLSTAPLTPVRNLTPAPQLLFDNPKAILESMLWLLNSKLAGVLDLIRIDKHSFNNNSKINNFSKLTLIINNNRLICNNYVVILLGRLNLIVHIVGVLTSRDQNRPSGFQRRQ